MTEKSEKKLNMISKKSSEYNDEDENNIGKKKDKENNLKQINNENTYKSSLLDSKSKQKNE